MEHLVDHGAAQHLANRAVLSFAEREQCRQVWRYGRDFQLQRSLQMRLQFPGRPGARNSGDAGAGYLEHVSSLSQHGRAATTETETARLPSGPKRWWRPMNRRLRAGTLSRNDGRRCREIRVNSVRSRRFAASLTSKLW